MKKLILMMGLAAISAVALAKLPAPVLDDAAKAKADEAKAKTAHAGKVDAYKLCLSMDRAAANHQKTAAATGKPVKPATATPPCSKLCRAPRLKASALVRRPSARWSWPRKS